ncbi:MAG: AI-2E family transporter [Acidimicrobiia bacterium]|nr:AI-2E family transporter [Acidimicrobiia bacterium]
MIDPHERLRRFGISAWALVGGFLVIGILGWLLAQVRILWGPVLAATAIIYILNPLVTGLRNRGVHRGFGTIVAYLLGVTVIMIVFAVVVPLVAEQANALGSELPIIYDDSISRIADTAARIGIPDLSLMSYDELVAQMATPDAAFQAGLQVFLGQAFTLALSVVELVALLFLTPVIAFYMLVDLPRVLEHTRELIPEGMRDEAEALGTSLGTALGGFVRGQMMVALLVATISSFGLWALGMNLWLILGIVAGLFNLIPFIGPWFSGTLAVVVALVLEDFRLAIFVALLFLGVQQLDNHVISPLVLRATVKLHPSLIILALLLGSSLAGILGLILAVPITAFLRVIVSHYWRTRILGESWEQASAAFTVEYEPPSPESLAGRLRRIGRMELTRPAMHHTDSDE